MIPEKVKKPAAIAGGTTLTVGIVLSILGLYNGLQQKSEAKDDHKVINDRRIEMKRDIQRDIDSKFGIIQKSLRRIERKSHRHGSPD